MGQANADKDELADELDEMMAEAEMEGMDVGIGNIAGPEKVPG